MESHIVQLAARLRPVTVRLRLGDAKGSGVIISDDGYILTAAHVSNRIDRQVAIELSTGEIVQGVALGAHFTLDAGLVRITDSRYRGRKWPTAVMSDGQTPQPGAWCLSLGHPGGTTDGQQAVARMGRVLKSRDWVLQTDCELVGGDSGGPLFDMAGRVIGINTYIKESIDSNFHVPVGIFQRSRKQLEAGDVVHCGASLGIFGEPHANGLRITRVVDESPAVQCGLQVGDQLLAYDSERVNSTEDLAQRVRKERPGKIVQLRIVRDGVSMHLNVELGLGDS